MMPAPCPAGDRVNTEKEINLKKNPILLFLVIFLIANLVSGQLEVSKKRKKWKKLEKVEFQKVRLTMNDGSEKTGFIDSSSSFILNVDDFLTYYQGQPADNSKFDFYPSVYTFPRNSLFYSGFAFCPKEIEWIDSEKVQKITALPTPREIKENGASSQLPKEVIEFLQGHTVFCAERARGKEYGFTDPQFTAFNCDPNISPDELHVILVKYIGFFEDLSSRGDRPWDDKALKKKMGWEKIWFFISDEWEVEGDD
jgi:hypothetical protein